MNNDMKPVFIIERVSPLDTEGNVLEDTANSETALHKYTLSRHTHYMLIIA